MGNSVVERLRQMGFSDKLIAGAMVDGKPISEAATKSTVKAEMNKTEALYALELEQLKRDGVVVFWWFESIKLRLAKRTWYTPDFFVLFNDGRMLFVEIKGFLREDAAVKFKTAREKFSWAEFTMIRRVKGHWVPVNI